MEAKSAVGGVALYGSLEGGAHYNGIGDNATPAPPPSPNTRQGESVKGVQD